MSTKKTLTFALMDPPYESENMTTAFRLMDAAARRGHDIKVFAYEGASALAFTRQAAHPNRAEPRNARRHGCNQPRSLRAACSTRPST